MNNNYDMCILFICISGEMEIACFIECFNCNFRWNITGI